MAEIQEPGSQAAETVEADELSSLLQKEFKPKSEEAKGAVEEAVKTLAEQALGQTQLISSDVINSIEAIVAELDKKLSEQINLILHHEDFQKLEGTWRGLHYLVNNTETDEMLTLATAIIKSRARNRIELIRAKPLCKCLLLREESEEHLFSVGIVNLAKTHYNRSISKNKSCVYIVKLFRGGTALSLNRQMGGNKKDTQ